MVTLASILIALPPMTRVAMLALASVPGEARERGRMAGCTGRQMTWPQMTWPQMTWRVLAP